jgi:hypothetical protein
MAVYVWLDAIREMIQFESMQEYNESEAYRYSKAGMGSETMVEENTPLWRVD